VPFAVPLLIVAALAAVSSYPPGVLFGLFVCYGLSGYVMAVARRLRKQRASSLSK
jgi:CDP-diacylglycerol--serine O-phosphatidyltransferase